MGSSWPLSNRSARLQTITEEDFSTLIFAVKKQKKFMITSEKFTKNTNVLDTI